MISSEGLSIDKEKLLAIQKLVTPKSVSELRSLLGFLTYSGRFIPNFAAETAPLRRLLKTGVEWNWSEEQETALQVIQKGIHQRLQYFDQTKETYLTVDAGPEGLGAILSQGKNNDHSEVVAYASKVLTDTERRYSQIEKEALAIFWAISHFHLYLCGRTFTVVTDHQPLVSLFNKPSSKPSLRIEKWILHL